ncbi:MAG TPA: hypothetical protein VHE55_01665 [Fimbriimonadaceae bacterium]|nr:hypothetical protein [Fimbriimonadaceae bacterium]
MQFPNVDPIPIPAPVWLMKALGLLTLALHFFAVQILIGSLLAVCYLSLRGRSQKSQVVLSAASVVAKRLPVVMTYVINLGVPPLLFAQVLYGRALYTSSVLIAVFWISVILLLMGCYWLLYRIADRASRGEPVIWHGLGALLLAASVGQIYSINMTLMLKPEVWQGMYANTASGLQAPPHDPTMMPRWLFVMTGGLIVGGLWMAIHANLKAVEAPVANLLKKFGSALTLVGVVIQLGVGMMVHSTQPENVQQGLGTPFYQASAGLWGLGLVLVLALAAIQFRAAAKPVIAWSAATAAFLSIAGAVLYRDGIRDITLMAKGFDVWKRTENSNWGVIGLFLILFVAGLGAVAWLLLVMKQAKAMPEEVQTNP